jgi:hypothetical protein
MVADSLDPIAASSGADPRPEAYQLENLLPIRSASRCVRRDVRLQVAYPLEHVLIPFQCVRGIEQVRAPKDRLSDLAVEHHCGEGTLTNETGKAATQEGAGRSAPPPCKATVTVLISYSAIALLGLDMRELRKCERLSLEI